MEENQNPTSVVPKKKKKWRFHFLWLLYALIGVMLLYVSYEFFDPDSFFSENISPKKTAWQTIEKNKKIIAVMNSSSSSYRIHNGKPMGFQYDMLLAFCKSHKLDMEIVIDDNIHAAIQKLNKNKVHVLAMDFTNVAERRNMLWYTAPYRSTRQVLIQRKKSKKEFYVDSIQNLIGQTVMVQHGTIYKKYLQQLTLANGIEANIIEDSLATIENLIAKVANGEINYTICDEHIAKLSILRHRNIDASLVLSDKQDVCWAVGVDQDSLLFHLNSWMSEFVKSRKFTALNNKYFKNPSIRYFGQSNFVSLKNGRLSQYDEIFRKEAIKLGWDWRLLASLVYEESHFNAEAVSWSGAVGLMQLMPTTARRFGAQDPKDAMQSAKAGVKYLIYLDKILAERVPNKEERIYFVLAAYTLGPAHVIDAINLAKKYNKNSTVWEGNVDLCLSYKSQAKYYNDEVVKSGYCNGQSAVTFVERIFERYSHYKTLVPFD